MTLRWSRRTLRATSPRRETSRASEPAGPPRRRDAAGGVTANAAIPPPQPTSSTEPSTGTTSRARSCDGDGSMTSGTTKSSGGCIHGLSGAELRISSGIAHASSDWRQCSAAVATFYRPRRREKNPPVDGADVPSSRQVHRCSVGTPPGPARCDGRTPATSPCHTSGTLPGGTSVTALSLLVEGIRRGLRLRVSNAAAGERSTYGSPRRGSGRETRARSASSRRDVTALTDMAVDDHVTVADLSERARATRRPGCWSLPARCPGRTPPCADVDELGALRAQLVHLVHWTVATSPDETFSAT